MPYNSLHWQNYI